MLWLRDEDFFRNYRGKLVVFGHTATAYLPPELSTYTPEDPLDVWAGPCCVGLDTGAGKAEFRDLHLRGFEDASPCDLRISLPGLARDRRFSGF